MERSPYSDAIRAAALAHYDTHGKIAEACTALGVARTTMDRWIKQRDKGVESGELMYTAPEQVAIYKQVQASEIRRVLALALQQIERKLPEASAAQAATVYGILYDKLNILETGNSGQAGNTTNNVIIQGMDRGDISRLLERTADRLKAEAVPAQGEVVDPENGD